MMTFMVFLATWVISGICIFCVLHPQYEDELVGRLALAAMCLGAFALGGAIAESNFTLRISPEVQFICIAFALFLSRHCYRFLRWRKGGRFGWPRRVGK